MLLMRNLLNKPEIKEWARWMNAFAKYSHCSKNTTKVTFVFEKIRVPSKHAVCSENSISNRPLFNWAVPFERIWIHREWFLWSYHGNFNSKCNVVVHNSNTLILLEYYIKYIGCGILKHINSRVGKWIAKTTNSSSSERRRSPAVITINTLFVTDRC